jgi:hypothetical protein
MKIIPLSYILKQQMYVAYQEGAKKDVERAFRALKPRFHILACSGHSFSIKYLL